MYSIISLTNTYYTFNFAVRIQGEGSEKAQGDGRRVDRRCSDYNSKQEKKD